MKKPNIVFWDLETLPNLPEALKVWPQLGDFPGRTLKADITSIICFGYMRLGEPRATVVSAWDFDGWLYDVNDDYEIVKAAYAILRDADIIVTHNGKRFDLGFINTRIMYWRMHRKDMDLAPLPAIAHVDTCQTVRKNMSLFSNRLSAIGKFLNVGDKVNTGGWDLWIKVWHRDPMAMAKMSRYCRGDVELTAKIFRKIRMMSKDLPNFNIFGEVKSVCPKCGSHAMIKRGTRPTKSKMVQMWQCKSCASWAQADLKQGTKRL